MATVQIKIASASNTGLCTVCEANKKKIALMENINNMLLDQEINKYKKVFDIDVRFKSNKDSEIYLEKIIAKLKVVMDKSQWHNKKLKAGLSLCRRHLNQRLKPLRDACSFVEYDEWYNVNFKSFSEIFGKIFG